MIRIACSRFLAAATLVKNAPALGNRCFSLATALGKDKSVYEMKKIGLKSFEFDRVVVKNCNKDSKKFDGIKANLRTIVETDAEVVNLATFCEDLDFFMLLVSEDEDIDLVTKSLKLYAGKVRKRNNPDFQRLGDRLVKLLYYLKKCDKALELYTDPKLALYFRGQTISFYLLNMLYEQKRFEDMVQVFYKYVEYLDPAKIEAKRYDLKTQKQLIPFGEIKMAAIALMMLNTRSSFEMFKNLAQVCEQYKSVLNNTSLVCWFLLSINQKEYQFAYELLFKFKWNYSLMHNLKAIALLKMNRHSEAYTYLELVTNVPTKARSLDGKFFKLTVESLEECMRTSKLSPNELKVYENLIRKMKSKLYEKDLMDYCLS